MKVAVMGTMVVLIVACNPKSSGGEGVAVKLADYTITIDEIPAAGTIDFDITNDGPSVHEFEIFSGVAEGTVLPVTNSVADTSGLELVDEIEDVLPASEVRLTVDLDPGTYLFICNLPGHYEQGMWAYVTVPG